MKYLFISLFPFLLLLGSLSSCQTELEIAVPEHTPQLVANCLVEAGTPFTIYVSRTFGFDEDPNEVDIYLPDATVELWENGILLETIPYTYSEIDVMHGYISNAAARAGQTYELRISHPDFTPMRQVMSMPSVPDITGLRFIRNAGLSDEGQPEQNVILSLTDPANEANYYEPRVSYRFPSDLPDFEFSFSSFLWEIEGYESASFGLNGRLITDDRFNGQNVELTLFNDGLIESYPDRWDTLQGVIWVTTRSYTEGAYQLFETYGIHRNAQRLIDFEVLFGPKSPVQMYTNGDGGYGIFAGFTERVDTLAI